MLFAVLCGTTFYIVVLAIWLLTIPEVSPNLPLAA